MPCSFLHAPRMVWYNHYECQEKNIVVVGEQSAMAVQRVEFIILDLATLEKVRTQ